MASISKKKQTEELSSQTAVFGDKNIEKLAKGATISLVGKIGGRGLHALGQIFLARLLGPGVYGLYGLGWTIFRLLGTLVPMGLDKGLIHFASAYWGNDNAKLKGTFLQTLAMAFTSGLLVGGIVFAFAPQLEASFEKPGLTAVLRLFALTLPFLSGLKVAAAATQLSHRIKYLVYSEDTGQPAFNLVILGILYFVGLTVSGAAAAALFSFCFGFSLAIYYVLRLFPAILSTPSEFPISSKQLLAFSLPAALAGLFSLFTVWMSRLFIGYFRPVEEVGIYQALSEASILATIILRGMNSIVSPMIARLHHEGDMQKLEELFRISTKWSLYLATPVFLTIFFAPTTFLTVVFGQDYQSGGVAFLILTLGQFVNLATGAVGFILVMTGHQHKWLQLSMGALVINVGLNYLFIPRWGLIGAALATSIAVSSLFITALFLVRHIWSIWPYDNRYLKGVIAATLTIICLITLPFEFIHIPFIELLLTFIVAVVDFTMTILLFGLDDEDRYFIMLLQKRVRGALHK